MSNYFLKLATEKDFSYCGEAGYCIKCLYRFHRDFINPIELARGEPSTDLLSVSLHEFLRLRGWREHLAEEMLTLPISDFLKLQYWDGHLRMAFFCLREHDLQAQALESWLQSFDDGIRFADVVLFYLVKPSYVGTPVGDAWIQKTVALAEQTKDLSLVESLVWTLGRSASNHPAFVSLAKELSQYSPSITKALNETAT